MKIKKELFINNQIAILEYNKSFLGKDANDLKNENYNDSISIRFKDNSKTSLCINGEIYYNDSLDDYENDFYFEVVDFDKNGNELSFSESIYDKIENEHDIVRLFAKLSNLVQVI